MLALRGGAEVGRHGRARRRVGRDGAEVHLVDHGGGRAAHGHLVEHGAGRAEALSHPAVLRRHVQSEEARPSPAPRWPRSGSDPPRRRTLRSARWPRRPPAAARATIARCSSFSLYMLSPLLAPVTGRRACSAASSPDEPACMPSASGVGLPPTPPSTVPRPRGCSRTPSRGRAPRAACPSSPTTPRYVSAFSSSASTTASRSSTSTRCRRAARRTQPTMSRADAREHVLERRHPAVGGIEAQRLAERDPLLPHERRRGGGGRGVDADGPGGLGQGRGSPVGGAGL